MTMNAQGGGPDGVRPTLHQGARKGDYALGGANEDSGMTSQDVTQEYEAFLVLDVESTCMKGVNFDYVNEIIEWPVCLMRWKNRDSSGKARILEVVNEFRSFVKPTWKPQLSEFCTELTGVTQGQVDAAPTFTEMLDTFVQWLVRNDLIDGQTGERTTHFCWCCDGGFDIRDFLVKQCFISKIPIPTWIQGNFIDVRRMVSGWYAGMLHEASRSQPQGIISGASNLSYVLPNPLSLSRQLGLLGLLPFRGREHCGIDDARNVSRILAELARRGVSLEPNAVIRSRRWSWMGQNGTILE
ncbi:hypothetical protein OBBRIDRAFT_822823 [Obba rivulosa]|uniref:Exonuclease domain-containing protein n=1 Tax=Obba rivulosa TaxID=1052685 RepID=A0A8E2DTG0_9APHY|nr:hypothetical protein OBBRIDRAFT_822823 [Obba rivulosa]